MELCIGYFEATRGYVIYSPIEARSARGAGISIIGGGGGGQIFIYSCSAQLISFEIDCFYSL